MRLHYCIAVLVLTSVLGCSPAELDSGASKASKNMEQPRIEDIASGYHDLRSMTEKPVFVDPFLAMLCRGASQQDVEEAQKKSGPHAHTSVSIFMDDLAAATFKASSGPYPVGSIIVKEKKGLSYWATDEGKKPSRTHDGVGGMVKRPTGFDPDHGDWEYFYFEDPAKIESGKIASCVQCHASAAKTDFVFGGWSKQTIR